MSDGRRNSVELVRLRIIANNDVTSAVHRRSTTVAVVLAQNSSRAAEWGSNSSRPWEGIKGCVGPVTETYLCYHHISTLALESIDFTT